MIAPTSKAPEFNISGPTALVLLVLFSPIVESLIMGGVLLVLLRLLPRTWAVLVSAIGWGIAHSLAIPIWGLVIWWPFLIFSTLFVVWRERSLWLAFGMPMVVHGLQNLPPALLVAFGIG
ncbi:MAG: type II CAAX prenyl endopeptidase Rce1 family protein [Sphingomicrobium sp.]